MTTLAWVEEARKHIGLKEITPNYQHKIKARQKQLVCEWLGNVAWCGVFVAHCLKTAGKPYPDKFWAAKSFESTPVELSNPAVGCIVVFTRKGGGHVGFVVGKDDKGNIMVLGGNQGDSVNIKPFAASRTRSYYWPSIYPTADRFILPIIHSNHSISENEA